MNKSDLVRSISQKTELSLKDSQRGLDTTLHVIREWLSKGETLTLIGLGTFSTYKRKPRVGRNPVTGKTVKIPSCVVPKFKAGSGLCEAVNTGKKK